MQQMHIQGVPASVVLCSACPVQVDLSWQLQHEDDHQATSQWSASVAKHACCSRVVGFENVLRTSNDK